MSGFSDSNLLEQGMVEVYQRTPESISKAAYCHILTLHEQSAIFREPFLHRVSEQTWSCSDVDVQIFDRRRSVRRRRRRRGRRRKRLDGGKLLVGQVEGDPHGQVLAEVLH